MNKIEKLIEKLCPSGVEWKTLGELGEFFSGLSGKTKDDFKEGNAKFIAYMNVYSNLALNTDVPDRVKISAGEKQNTLEKGDAIFTGSSETPDECGMSSVVTVDVTEPLYLNSFCFGFRLTNKDLFNPDFLKHLLRSTGIRRQITRTASGVTRFNVSKAKMAKVVLPVPPIEIQSEIVQVLDNFAKLTAELTAELAKRKKQYEHYRDTLLSGDWPRVKLGKIAEIERGNGLQKKDFVESGFPCIHYGQIYTRFGVEATKTISFVKPELAENLKKVYKGQIVMAVTSENVEDVCKCTCWMGEEAIVTGGHTAIIRPKQNGKYLSYYFRTSDFFDQKRRLAHGTKVIEVTPSKLVDIEIPLPPLAEQERIVAILDKFDKLVNSLTEGLPAEIAGREKQYAYYRDRLLSFGRTAS